MKNDFFLSLGSNWASRQGLTDVIRELLKSRYVGSNGVVDTKNVRLSAGEEAIAGVLGMSYYCLIIVVVIFPVIDIVSFVIINVDLVTITIIVIAIVLISVFIVLFVFDYISPHIIFCTFCDF